MILESFKSRSSETERIDRGEFTVQEYQRWQKEMWFIHRFFGEIRALRKTLVGDIAGNSDGRLTVMEIAAGSGGLLTYLRERLPRLNLRCIGLEISHDSAGSIAANGHLAVRGDALLLPFADNSVDYVFCTLFLHHLDTDEAARMVGEMRRVARRKLVVIDLDRRPIPYFIYRVIGTLLLQSLTRQDGALSIKRAYRACELGEIAKRSGLTDFHISKSAINRLILHADAGDH